VREYYDLRAPEYDEWNQSASMLDLARERVPRAEVVVGDGLALPFDDASFVRA
jgi:ubiquinone/menaquinone biosynthesis C-methylase UbiE